MTKMIGQERIQERVLNLIESNKFPRFCLLVGEQGSGRKTIAQWIGEQLDAVVDMCGIDVDSVRNVIEHSYNTSQPMLYIFPDADNMSLAAKNALLKVTEEPPRNARFIMTVMSTSNVLPTIESRAFVLRTDSYSIRDIVKYYREIVTSYRGEVAVREEWRDIFAKYCSTPGDVNLLCSYDIDEFDKFVHTVVQNIDKVSGSNSFKIGSRLDLGTDEKKYDLALFWKAFIVVCFDSLASNPFKYISGVTITSRYKDELRLAGINKQMCFDNWLLDIRKEWMKYAESNED